jgi:hypothetical protein
MFAKLVFKLSWKFVAVIMLMKFSPLYAMPDTRPMK